MVMPRLNLSPEERKQHDKELHRQQELRRRDKRQQKAFEDIVWDIKAICEDLGWNEMDLLVGLDESMVKKVAKKLKESGKYKMIIGKHTSIKKIDQERSNNG